MKQFTSRNQKIGKTGEDICCKYLQYNKFKIIERNFTVPTGEIDIIAQKDTKIHFIEVKSVSCENTYLIQKNIYNPAENMTRSKIQKCQSAVNEYLVYKNVSYETQLDLYIVYIDKKDTKHKIEIIENIF